MKQQTKDAAVNEAARLMARVNTLGTRKEILERLFDAGAASIDRREPWVAVEDCEPDKDGWYSCTVDDNDGFEWLVEPYWFDSSEGLWTDGDDLGSDACKRNRRTVIAWMPLPEPYKQENQK